MTENLCSIQLLIIGNLCSEEARSARMVGPENHTLGCFDRFGPGFGIRDAMLKSASTSYENARQLRLGLAFVSEMKGL